MKILVVDDSRAIRFKLRHLLEELGHTVVAEAANGKEALAAFSTSKPDLVTLDIVMPEMDGISTLAELRKMDPHLKVVMVTSAGTIDNMLKTKDAGASHFLIKPFTKEKVAEVVDNLVARK